MRTFQNNTVAPVHSHKIKNTQPNTKDVTVDIMNKITRIKLKSHINELT